MHPSASRLYVVQRVRVGHDWFRTVWENDQMMYIAMNRFRVAPDKQEAFKARWLDREVLLRTVPGFVSFQFLKGPEREDHVLYASHTVWASEEAFINWTKSEQFRQAHATAGDGVKLTIGGPVFEGFTVLQNVEA